MYHKKCLGLFQIQNWGGYVIISMVEKINKELQINFLKQHFL